MWHRSIHPSSVTRTGQARQSVAHQPQCFDLADLVSLAGQFGPSARGRVSVTLALKASVKSRCGIVSLRSYPIVHAATTRMRIDRSGVPPYDHSVHCGNMRMRNLVLPNLRHHLWRRADLCQLCVFLDHSSRHGHRLTVHFGT